MAELDEVLQQVIENTKRLEAEEADHAEIKKAVADTVIAVRRNEQHLKELEMRLSPLIEVAPVMADFAATGRIGRMLGKIAIGFAAFLAAIAGVWFSVTHGFGK